MNFMQPYTEGSREWRSSEAKDMAAWALHHLGREVPLLKLPLATAPFLSGEVGG